MAVSVVLTTVESAQPLRAMEIPRQRSRSAITAKAARQCEAWLSPISAIAGRDGSVVVPNPHTNGARRWIGVHGAFGASKAS